MAIFLIILGGILLVANILLGVWLATLGRLPWASLIGALASGLLIGNGVSML